ncbi:choline dehydrogenase, putative [Trypanosoma brucei gambiense DAL972]|uniref:Choline dehydrogenase, putative n=1 Tax=Trypanosoma brucei gambiense (strain MHOM/CI/86/DAL972) TaxID=679716 RepID=D0A120_TRYB9|nr:choline dehydrogenase, putative [Trypanosoma brucei gambiense DAL972]CBH14962.1 choline dehydrogenase, putative [Trypanosoma brucei gambiense DAL972]|eukprot:XP_011777228.1 choline dehydrogenase, putative [Trypanosoma brucei gambiense DAL972]
MRCNKALHRYDAVVVGGGLAGCLVAGRLAMDNRRIAVIEEGEDIRRQPRWHRNLACSLLSHRCGGRGYESHTNVTTPQLSHEKENAPAPVMIPTPKVLGGGGVMGGRSWLIGDEADWTATPWDFRGDLLPRVQRLENVEGAGPHRGRRGRFTVGRSHAQSPLFRVFCEAMSKDTSITSDFNKKAFAVRTGCGRTESFVDPNTGVAHTTLQSYLMDAIELRRPLDVICNARVFGISSGKDDPAIATGVSYTQKGETVHVEADDVILCAGGIGTPLLLAASRGSLPIDQSVGTNFWDAPQVKLQFRTPSSLSHNCFMDPLVQAFLWPNVTYGTPISSLRSAYDDMICFWSSTGGQTPDVKFIFQPFTLNNDGSQPKNVTHGVQIIAQLLKPKSRGSICADGTINPQYFSHTDDAAVLSKAVARVKELSKVLPFSNLFSELIAEHFESAGVYGGATYPAVAPETFLVKGTRNVYACDESILPSPLLGGSLPFILALGEKFSDHYLQKLETTGKAAASEGIDAKARIIY